MCSIEPSLDSRGELLDRLSDVLTINEAAALISRVHEKNRIKTGMSKAKRFGLFPVEDWNGLKRTLDLQASLWLASEIEFHEDRDDFNEFTPEEQRPLIMAFGFFAVGDGSIASMLAYQMILTARNFENQMFYATQLFNECVHGETYGNMIYTLVPDAKGRDEIFNAVENIKSIREMNAFIENAFTFPQGEKHKYVSLAASEYLLFTPLFCIIFWYRAYKKGKIPRTIFSNEQIAKDEAGHCENGCVNYRELPDTDKYTDEEVHTYVDKVVCLVSNFADEVLFDVNLPDLTPENVKQYIRYVADDLFDRLDHSKYYNVINPYTWMTFTNLVPKTNFYEGSVGEYKRFNVSEYLQRIYELCNGVNAKTDVNKKAKILKF